MGGSQTKSLEKDLCMQLHNAISDGNQDLARELLMCRAVNPNSKLFVHSRKLDPPLFTAVENNCLSMVEMLLQYDAKIATFNRNGFTPLHVAVAQNFEEIAETLIRHNANPCAPNTQGESSLHVAATYGLVNMTELLLRSGASVNIRGKLNRTPLHSACAIPGNTSMTMSLLNHGADPDLQDEEQKTPLHYLAQLGNSQGIDILLQAGASKNLSDVNGKSALHVSVENEEISATRALLRHRCDVNCQDVNGHTPLYKATEKEFSELVTLLLEHGADPNIPSSNDKYPIRHAVWRKNLTIAKSLLDNGANVNATDRTGITPLHVACLYGNTDEEDDIALIEILLCAGANINAQCTKLRRTPLHTAVECGNEEVVLLLLQNGADSSILDTKGKSPLSLSTKDNISNLLSESDGGNGLNLSTLSCRREQNQTSSPGESLRRMNFYTRPTTHPPLDVPPPSVNGPPPLPPRDNPQSGVMPSGVIGNAANAVPTGVPVFRRNFVWSPREPTNGNAEDNDTVMNVLNRAPSKFLSFATNFSSSNPHVMCHNITLSKQTINTDLGCTLHIPHSSVHSNFLLYVEGHNYTPQTLPLPSGHYLCSNMINFYTHSAPSRYRGNAGVAEKPEREIPHFQKLITVKFALRPSAMAKYDDVEMQFKVFASFDDGGIEWEELGCKLETVQVGENGETQNATSSEVNFLTVETDELGILVAMICPKQDFHALSLSSEKVFSSIDPAIFASVGLNQGETATIDLEALKVPSSMIENLNRKDFSYVVGSSREVRLCVKNDNTERLILSLHMPCSTVLRTNQADVTHRVLMKSEKWSREVAFCSDSVRWTDVTETDCQQLTITQKGKKLLGQTNNDPLHNISFRIMTDVPVRLSFIVVAVRSYTSTLSSHLVALPKHIATMRDTSSICFLINQKANRACEVMCDVVPPADANQTCSRYRRNGSYKGPQPSLAQEIRERDCIVINAVGGLRLNQKKESCRRIIFHSALQPFNDHFFIKGVSNHHNSASKYSGSIEFSIDTRQRNPSTARLRSPLNSESSVLVMENALATEPSTSATQAAQSNDKKLLASLPVELPRKGKSKKAAQRAVTPAERAARASEKSFLSDAVMQRICKSLDEPEVKELAFQLGIDDEKVSDSFNLNGDNLEAAGMHLLKAWRLENAVKEDVVQSICLALRCIGRDNVAQDVSRRCDPFPENSIHIPSLPVFTRNMEVVNAATTDGEER